MSAATDKNNLSDYETTSLDDLLQRPVAFHRAFLKFGAGVTGALMLSQAFYWSSKTRESDYWFYKTRQEWEEETGLSRYEQEGARKRLVKFGVLEEDKRGIPCKLFYRVNRRVLTDVLLGEIPQSSRRDGHKLAGVKPKPPAGRKKKPQPVGGNSPSQAEEKPPANTESTQESTEESTHLLSTAKADDAEKLVLEGEIVPHEETDPLRKLILLMRERRPADLNGPKNFEEKTTDVWVAYAVRYKTIYKDYPLWNAVVGRQLSLLIDRVGKDIAPFVAVYYLRLQKSNYTSRCHPVELLLQDCQAIYIQWKSNTSMTDERARQIDKTETNRSAADEAEELVRLRFEERRRSDANS